jgi:salicylate hydroxylase
MCLRSPKKHSPFYTYQVRRLDLRQMLLSAVDPVRVTWGVTAVSYANTPSESSSAPISVTLSDGRVIGGDLLVIADGARSKLRKQMLGLQGKQDPKLGLMMINGRVDVSWGSHSMLSPEKVLFALGVGSSVFASVSGASTGWSYAIPTEPHLLVASPDTCLKTVRDRLRSWMDPIPELLAATNPSSIRVTELLDVPQLTMAVDERAVLIGDAAHPMTPHRGLGANTALLDALDLSALIVDLSCTPGLTTKTISQKLQSFAGEMLKRSGPCVAASRAASLSYHNTSRMGCMVRNVVLWGIGCILALFS